MSTIFTYVPVMQRYSVGHVLKKQTHGYQSAAHLPHAMRGYTPQLAVLISLTLQTNQIMRTKITFFLNVS